MFTVIYQSKEYRSASLHQPAKRVEMTLDTQEATTDELCQFFGDFIKGCGYILDADERLEFVKDEDADAQEFAAGLINEEFSNSENVDTTGYEPVSERPNQVQTEFNFEQKPQ